MEVEIKNFRPRKMQGRTNKLSKSVAFGLIGRVAGATFLAITLLVFLVMMRLLDAKRIPDRVIRTVDTISEVAPPPPPPLELQQESPPPPPSRLPKLDLQIENVAPPLVGSLDPLVDLTMRTAEFELESRSVPRPLFSTAAVPLPKKQSQRTVSGPQVQDTVSVGELDSKPRLLNRPATRYPTALLRRGIRSGMVLLEVAISTSGRVNVRRVLSSTHPELTKMATSFASRARFTVPRKNGQSVNAIYRWPITLQPPK